MKKRLDELKYQKSKNNGALILFKVGDFYESYDTDALVLHECLGISVTTTKVLDSCMYAIAGFPYYKVDEYIRNLVRAGHRVVIVDKYNNNNQNNEKMNNEKNEQRE